MMSIHIADEQTALVAIVGIAEFYHSATPIGAFKLLHGVVVDETDNMVDRCLADMVLTRTCHQFSLLGEQHVER